MLRKPKIDVPSAVPDNHLIWHSLACELITPMYGGGTVSTKVDEKMPIRASSIRGALRFWWRLLAKNHANKEVWNVKNIKQAESELWGGVGNGDDDGKASKVLLKITKQPKVNEQNLISYDELNRLRYVLFPAYNETDDDKKPHKLLKPDNIKFQLEFALVDACDAQRQQIVETLQWWANFGGLGFRSRKGLGAIAVTECTDFPEICQSLTTDDVKQADCLLQIRQQNHPTGLQALETGIQKYADFRQRAGVGRNEPSEEAKKMKKPAGRSCFPEPDALRRIQRNLGYDNRHEPVHQAGNVFPRAVFGLPILFHSHQERAVNATVNPSNGERLASPLIIRPRKNGNSYQVVALALPYQDILNQNVVINGNEYPIWQNNIAKHNEPIKDNGGGDPIQAFLTYFVRP